MVRGSLLLQHNCSVVSRKHTCWSLLCHLAHKVPVVSVISNFLRGGVIGPMPNPQPGGPGSVLCGPCSPWPNQQGQTYQGLASVPAFIALGIIEAFKRHYNNRVNMHSSKCADSWRVDYLPLISYWLLLCYIERGAVYAYCGKTIEC